MRYSRTTALLILFCPLAQLLADEVYKSVDADGHVVYSDRPSATAQKSDVHVDRPDPSEVARLAKEQQILKAEDLQRKGQQSAEDKRKAQEEHDRQIRCDKARNQYYAMKDARRIFERDADGNRVYYSDTEGDAKREEARQAMTVACGT